MVQSLQLGASNQADEHKGMRRLNRLPIIIAIVIIIDKYQWNYAITFKSSSTTIKCTTTDES